MRRPTTSLLACCFLSSPLALFPTVVLAQATPDQSGWTYELIPYLWASSIDGREGVGQTTADVSASFGDLIDFVNVGGALRVTATREAVGWYAEASYVSLGDSANSPFGPLHLRSDQTLGEAGVSFDIRPTLALYAGLRYQDVGVVIEGPARRVDQDRGWLDAVGGLKWSPILTDHWSVWARGDAGGGSSKLVWLAEAGTGYHWGSRWSAYLSYRVLDTDYEHNGFVYDVKLSGLLFGFGVRL